MNSGVSLIPEAVAFAFVAHVEPMVGLYAAFIMGLRAIRYDFRRYRCYGSSHGVISD
ncbi:SulP family inorganic anion transporter [Shewanella sp. BF02_Schw]|uniref:SulP family inorganic anion transporter n=1 Tax=Shewanella sp. BF02_Schw TaxID=394908 RepID=UPI0032608403